MIDNQLIKQWKIKILYNISTYELKFMKPKYDMFNLQDWQMSSIDTSHFDEFV